MIGGYMKKINLHRNSQKRFHGSNKIYFITTNTIDRFPFFQEELFCELFVENLRLCKELRNFKLFGFIIIPEHVHLQLKPEDKFNISQIMHTIKRHFSRNANLMIDINNEIFSEEESEVCKPRFHLDKHIFNKEIIKYHNKFIKEIRN